MKLDDFNISYKIFGIQTIIHWTVIPFILFSILLFGNPMGFIMLYAFVIMHEFGHAKAAEHFGLKVSKITLYFFGGIASIFMPINIKPKQDLQIALAGPAVNFGLAIISTIGFFLTSNILLLNNFFFMAIYINIILGAFNLLPAMPLDGGRALKATLGMYSKDVIINQAIVRNTSLIVGLSILTLGVCLFDASLILIGAFILYLHLK